MSLADAIAQGDATGPDIFGLQQLVVGTKPSTISAPEPITGNMKTVSVYAPSSFNHGDVGT